MNHRNHSDDQKGFVGVVFLVIALIGIVIAAIAGMSRSANSGATGEAMKANVTVVLKQTADFKTGFDQMVAAGVVPPVQITFDKTVGTGLFDPALRFAILNSPPAQLVASGAATYTYNNQVRLPGIGFTGSSDYVVTLGNVTLPGCQQINKLLYDDAVPTVPATSTGSLAQWTTAPAAIADNAGAQAAATNYNGRPEGCVLTSDGLYVYYKALAEN